MPAHRHTTLLALGAALALTALPLAGQPFAPSTAARLLPASSSFESEAPPRLQSSLSPAPPAVRESADPLSQVQKAIREAERHFQSGKFFIQEGKQAEARREFDHAISLLLDVPADAIDRAAAERRCEELARLIHRYDLDSLGSGLDPESPVFVPSPLASVLQLTFPIDPSLKGRAEAQINARASQLPLVVNDAVLSYINFFTSERGRRTLYAGLKRSGRYKDMITRILDEEGVPRELIFLAQAESAFFPRAVSYASAVGMWQFIRSRGSEYGLDATKTTDERLDPEKATRAAARHLRDLYQQTGDWHLAMAAYNCGPACVERAVQRTGYADFWELRTRRVLPTQTMNYVPAILALAIVSANLEAYGLHPVDFDPALEYDTVTVTAPTGLALIADASDLPVSEIRELNPALLKNLAPAGFDVRVPKGRAPAILAALQAVPEERRAAWRLHRVSDGESLASIARRYSTAAGAIVQANPALAQSSLDTPASGDVLLIPAALKAEPALKSSRSSRRYSAASARRASPRVASVRSRGPARKSASR